MRTSRHALIVMAIAMSSLASADQSPIPGGSADSITDQAHSAEMSYFDQRITLGVDPTMIAVYVDPGRAGAEQIDLAAALAEVELETAETQSSSIAGWTYVVLSNDWPDARAAVRRLETLGRFDLVSRVYLGEGGLPVIPTRDLLVSFATDATPAEEAALLAEHGAIIVERDAAGTAGLVRARTTVSSGARMFEIASDVNDHAAVEWAQCDRIVWVHRFGGAPDDPLFNQQWALEQDNDEDMDALGAWDVSVGDADVRVVVLDSGVQQDHPDLHQVSGQTFTGAGGSGGPSNSCDNHGTAVSGCVSATINNGLGIVGIAPGTRVQSGKIFNEIVFFGFCLPFLEGQDSWTAAGINWAADTGARVTNSSWGGGAAAPVVTNAFDTTRAAGVVHFAAAGNDGSSTIGFPANLDSVNAVAALNSSGNRASFSTFGNGLFISAPGENVLSTDRTGGDGYAGGDWTSVDGTSFASPYTAGVAALVISVDPSLTPDEVEDVLAQTAVDKSTPGYDTGYGWGFVNAAAAVAAVNDTEDCPADLTGSGTVDVDDLLVMLAAWGESGGDVDGNGTTDSVDLLALLAAWGECP